LGVSVIGKEKERGGKGGERGAPFRKDEVITLKC